MSTIRGIAILGSTGSIGRSTLAVIGLHPDRFRVAVLGAYGSWQTVVEQALRFEPDVVVLVDPEAAREARAALEAFLRSDCETARWVRDHLKPRAQGQFPWNGWALLFRSCRSRARGGVPRIHPFFLRAAHKSGSAGFLRNRLSICLYYEK